jgi:uncharacterized membrane protein YsdA (DUF1294 family)
MNLFSYYLIAINILALIMMLIDKQSARNHKWRIPEARLFIYATIFGAFGIWLGMYVFNHKTRHKKFSIGIPLILVVQCTLIFYFNLIKY